MVSGLTSDGIIVLEIALDTIVANATDGYITTVHDKVFIA